MHLARTVRSIASYLLGTSSERQSLRGSPPQGIPDPLRDKSRFIVRFEEIDAYAGTALEEPLRRACQQLGRRSSDSPLSPPADGQPAAHLGSSYETLLAPWAPKATVSPLVQALYMDVNDATQAPTIISFRARPRHLSPNYQPCDKTLRAMWTAAFHALCYEAISHDEVSQMDGRALLLVPAVALLQHMGYWLREAGPQKLWMPYAIFASGDCFVQLSSVFEQANFYAQGHADRMQQVLAVAWNHLAGMSDAHANLTQDSCCEAQRHGQALAAAVNKVIYAQRQPLNDILMDFWPEFIEVAPGYLAAQARHRSRKH